VAVNTGSERVEFLYDGQSQLAGIRQLTNGVQASFRRFLWCNQRICEERDQTGGAVTKRFYTHGMKIESGPATGSYYYTRDHLGSVRELTDGSGSVRASYTYDPFGRRTKTSGDLESDFGFAGYWHIEEIGLSIARFRAYDPELGRWLARDPLRNAEHKEGPNLYAYAQNNPVNLVDPLGLCCEDERDLLTAARGECGRALKQAGERCATAWKATPEIAIQVCLNEAELALETCIESEFDIKNAAERFYKCLIDKKCDADICLNDPFRLPEGCSGKGPDGLHRCIQFPHPCRRVHIADFETGAVVCSQY